MQTIEIVGAGPAGSAAAIAARFEGADVSVSERSRTARHKVCGEFLSPAVCGALRDLDVWDDFLRLGPARVRRCVLHFGQRRKEWKLSETAYGLSRLQLDRMLVQKAGALGAVVQRGETGELTQPAAGTRRIVAAGRLSAAPRGKRLFGFKTHFEGPADDAVELFFLANGYVGVSSIENSWTNVCGIAPEETLSHYGFRVDDLIHGHEALAERLRPLSRRMDWLTVGPLQYSKVGAIQVPANVYPTGDALGFVDPFTGSGILNALLTGQMAGTAAARGVSSETYLHQCREAFRRPFGISAMLRSALTWSYASQLAALVPGPLLFRLTRHS